MNKEEIYSINQFYENYKEMIHKSFQSKSKMRDIVLPYYFWKFAYFHTSLLLNIKYLSDISPQCSINYNEIIPDSPFIYTLYPSHIYFDSNDIYIGSRCSYADPTSHLSHSGIITVLDYKTKKLKKVITAHYGEISAIRVNEKYIASVVDEGVIHLWDRRTYTRARSFEYNSKVIAIDINEHFVICCSKDKRLEVLETSENYHDQRIVCSIPINQYTYTLSYSNQRFATESKKTNVDFYDFETFHLFHKYDIDKPIRRVLLQDNECLIGCKSLLQLYDLRSGPINSIDLNSITPRLFMFDDYRIILSDSDSYLHFIDKRMLRFISKHDPHKRKSSFIRFHYDSNLDQIATCGDDRRIHIFDYSEYIEPKISSPQEKCSIQ